MKFPVNVQPELIILKLLKNITITRMSMFYFGPGILILIHGMNYALLFFCPFASNKRDKIVHV